jgi:sodium/hydrogen antiporter
VIAVTLGAAFGRALTAREVGILELVVDWRLVYTVALSLFAVGLGRAIGSDELLLVFAAGVAFVQLIPEEDRKDEEKGQEAVNRFFSIPIFALFGMTIPWAGWRELGLVGVLVALAVVLLRRLPTLFLIRPLLRRHRPLRDTLFLGWFGPIAVAAIYSANLVEADHELPVAWEIVSLVVCVSVVVHGLTSTPFTRLYGRYGRSAGDPEMPDPEEAQWAEEEEAEAPS